MSSLRKRLHKHRVIQDICQSNLLKRQGIQSPVKTGYMLKPEQSTNFCLLCKHCNVPLHQMSNVKKNNSWLNH